MSDVAAPLSPAGVPEPAGRVWRAGAGRLERAGLPSPEADARTLLAWALGVEPSALVACRVDAATAERFARLVAERAAGVPVQYLTGEACFRTVRLRVGPGVFIPRPETEALAGWAIRCLTDRGTAAGPAPVVVDLAAGSGAISLAIAAERPGCEQCAVEIDPVAFGYLQANLRPPLSGGKPVRLVRGDAADALPDLDGRVDLVVSNPPYIPERDRHLVAADVLAHEPALALFSGPDGLDGLRVVARTAARLLRPGGWLGVEHDETTGEAAVAHLAATGVFGRIEDHRDLAGRPRFVTARKLAG